jgi:hypothetical protein
MTGRRIASCEELVGGCAGSARREMDLATRLSLEMRWDLGKW